MAVNWLIIRVLWRSGMRARELVTIRFKDVEWDNCVVNILIHCGIAMRSTWSGGGDVRRVQLLLGHAGIQTTTVYIQSKDADLREVREGRVLKSQAEDFHAAF